MSGKKLIFAISALVVAILVIVLSEQLGKRKPSDKVVQFFPGLTQKDISAFEITEPSGKIKIQRKGDIWIIGFDNTEIKSLNPMNSDPSTVTKSSTTKEYQVDSAALVSALEKVVEIRKSQLISQNPDKQSLFEVDTAKGLLLEIFDNSGVSKGSVRIGKSGPDYSSNYVRATGSNSVYMVGGSIKNSFFTDPLRWRDNTIIKFEQSTVQSISIAIKDSSKLTMVKDSGSTWSLKEPIQAPVKSSEIGTILSSLSRFVAESIDTEIASDSAAGLSNPEMIIAITFSSGSTKNIIFGTKNADNQYRIKADGKEHIFLVSEDTFNDFTKKPEELKDDPPKDTVTSDPAK